jgi:hypothetical protein
MRGAVSSVRGCSITVMEPVGLFMCYKDFCMMLLLWK